MPTQNYANHPRFVTLYHRVWFRILVLTLFASAVNLVTSFGDYARLYSASLIVVLTLCALMLSFMTRTFPLTAQDRAIRAAENPRHFAATGQLLDPRLSVKQVVALRFASDSEFVPLAAIAAKENLTPDQIKRAIKQWRADEYRV